MKKEREIINKKSNISKINFLSKRKSYVRKSTAQTVLGLKQPTHVTSGDCNCGTMCNCDV